MTKKTKYIGRKKVVIELSNDEKKPEKVEKKKK